MGESWCFSCPSCDLGHLWAAVFLELLLRREDQQKTQYQCVKGIFSQIWKCSTSAGDGFGLLSWLYHHCCAWMCASASKTEADYAVNR